MHNKIFMHTTFYFSFCIDVKKRITQIILFENFLNYTLYIENVSFLKLSNLFSGLRNLGVLGTYLLRLGHSQTQFIRQNKLSGNSSIAQY